MSTTTINFNNVTKDDFKLLQRRKPNSKINLFIPNDKRKLYYLIISAVSALISFIIIISIISYWRSTSKLAIQYNDLSNQFNKVKAENENLYQTLGTELKVTQDLNQKLNTVLKSITSFQDKYNQLQKENLEVIKELTAEVTKEEEYKKELQIIQDALAYEIHQKTLEQDKTYSTFDRHDFIDVNPIRTPWNPWDPMMGMHSYDVNRGYHSMGDVYNSMRDEYIPSSTGYIPMRDGYIPTRTGYIPMRDGYIPTRTGYIPMRDGLRYN